MAILTLITGIVKAIPYVDGWVQQFIVFYTNKQIDSMREENRQALIDIIIKKDQRGLEKAIGNPNPGAPSGDAGTVIRDKPPL